jgi:lysophospholipase L1-like esterase
MRARDRGRAYGRIVALGTALAVICAAAPATVAAEPGTQRQPGQQQQKRVFRIVVVGDSFSSGEGIRDTYVDSRDPRHQSRESAAIQAAARIQAANPDLQVEVTIVASSGSTTSDVFETQRKDPAATIPGGTPQNPLDQRTWHHENDLAVNYAQLGQIPTDADAVIIGLGGNDSLFGPLVKSMVTENREEARKLEGAANRILDDTEPDEVYQQQADLYPDGYAPTLIARLIQVTRAVRNQAKNAQLFVQNYPIAVDPSKSSWFDLLGEDLGETDLQRMMNFAARVNTAIERAIHICQCATLADVSKALEGRELNSENPAINSVWFGTRGDAGQMKMSEPFHPNREGAALMSDDIGIALSRGFGFTVPERQKDARTDTGNITIRNTPAPDTDRDGHADYQDWDWDNDGYSNFADQDPNVANPPPPTRRPRTAPPGETAPTTQQGPNRGTSRGTRGPNDAAPGEPAPASPPRRPSGGGGEGDGGGDAGGGTGAEPAPPPRPPNGGTERPPQRPGGGTERPPRPPGGTDNQPPTPPKPQQPSPQQPPPRPPDPPAPPRPDANSGGGRTDPPPPRQLNSPVIPPSTPMRTPSAPSIPKTPSPTGFDPNFHPQGVKRPNVGGGSVLGVKPPTPPGPTLPSPRGPISKYPLGGGKRTDPPLSGSKVPDDGSLLPPPPGEQAPAPPPPPTQGGSSGTPDV